MEKEKSEIYCLDCDKYYKNIELYNKEHDKTVYKVLNKTHNYIEEGNSLKIISKIIQSNKFLSSAIKEQQKEISDITKRLDIYEDSLKDVSFDCNIVVKNGKDSIKNLGKCNLQFFPRNIYFKIECEGDIERDQKNIFQIDIIFPFRKANIKMCSIEKINGCYLTKEILDSEGNPFMHYHNYIPYLEQKNFIVSAKTYRDYKLYGKFENKKINIILNGILSFDSLIGNFNYPIILFNILDKTFLCYENYEWIFKDNFTNAENGNLNKNCLVNLLLDENDENKVRIKGEHKYLGFEPNYITLDENKALFDIHFLNKMYGLIEISKNGKYLTQDKDGKVCFKQEKTFYLICNI